jgi:AcrR family transcriptional regulator
MSGEERDLKTCILSEANRLFVGRGYNAVSMREIAEVCGVSKAALYYHFRDKENLFIALLEDYLDEIQVVIERERLPGGTIRQQLDRVVKAIFEQSPEKRAIIRLASQEMPNLSLEARAAFGGVYYGTDRSDACTGSGCRGAAPAGYRNRYLGFIRHDVSLFLPWA